jgi:hypothetical protein
MMRFRAALDSERECRASPVEDLPASMLEAMKRLDVTSRYRSLLVGREGPSAPAENCVTSCEVRPVEPTQAELTNQERCNLLSQPYTGEYFTFLMSHSVSSRTDSFVGYTTNPLRDVYLHNQKHVSDRNTCGAAPHWLLDIVLGPFISKELAIDCGLSWVTGTRGKTPKREKAPFLSSAYYVGMYTYMKRSGWPLADLLEWFAEPCFLALHESDQQLVVEQGQQEEEDDDEYD